MWSSANFFFTVISLQKPKATGAAKNSGLLPLLFLFRRVTSFFLFHIKIMDR